MRTLCIVAICVMLGGCAASAPEGWEQPGQEYVGRHVDALMAKWGPPTSTLRMKNGQISYIWQLATEMSADLVRTGSGSTGTYACKVNVVASPTGIVEQIQTEDYQAGKGLLSFAGTAGNMCGERLDLRRLG